VLSAAFRSFISGRHHREDSVPSTFSSRIAILALLFGTSIASAQRGQATPPTSVRELQQIYQRFLDGIRKRDTASYRDLLTPDYFYVGGDSNLVVSGRSARLRRDLESPDRWDAFDAERCDLSIHDNIAVGPCWYHITGMSAGQHGDWHGISMVTFVRSQAGTWQIAATRPTVLPTRP
jgi:hypothetical protein